MDAIEKQKWSKQAAGGTNLPPELSDYRDEGCELADSCLECPFPCCLCEEPRSKHRWVTKARDREIRRLTQRGKKVEELAQVFNVSLRTIQRVIKRAPG